MSKRNKKRKKKLYLLLFILLIFVVSFFINKDLYNSLKDTIVGEIKSSVTKIKDELNKDNNTKKISNIKLNKDFMILFIDVGQADSILIKSNDEYMLIDAGNNKDGAKLTTFFSDLNIKEFKYVVGTHAHEDHIGGMDNIIKNFKIKNFYMPDEITTTESFNDVLSALESKNIKFQTPNINQKLKLGDAVINIIYVGTNMEDLNDTSIILKITYKDTSYLFTGDATSEVEKEILNKDIESDVLKVGHHGSKYSNSAQFLNKVKPKYAIISCGKNNDYGHPHSVVVDKLKKLKATIYRTDKLGTIVLTSDGKNINIMTVKTDTNGGDNDKR